MVEFALLLPILVLFTFGIIEFGRGYNARIQLTAAVRDGARVVALGKDEAAARTATRNSAAGLDASKIAVTAPDTCPPESPPGSNATVNANYPLRYDIPLFRSGTWTLSAKAVMRCVG